jgi:hypothetical protein
MKKLITIGICFTLIITILVIPVNATPPETPGVPAGPTEILVNELCEYTVTGINASDPVNGLYYIFNWGDGFNTGWLGPYPSGTDQTITAMHKFHKAGVFEIKVKAKDNITEEESAFSEPLIVIVKGGEFRIGEIRGGFGVSAQIINALAPSKYVKYKIEISGGSLPGFHVLKRFNGTVFIESSDLVTINTGPFFGLGRLKVTATAECAGEEVAEKVEFGRIFLIYVII